jgi:hypothetical protein
MSEAMIQLWLFRVAGLMAALIVIEVLRRFWKAKPCWFFNHTMRHLSIEKRVWPNGICHRCNESMQRGKFAESYRHLVHARKTGDRTDWIPCYVTKWVCSKEGCGEMGFFCAGDEDSGAWTVQHGEIVPDEKEWSRWKA